MSNGMTFTEHDAIAYFFKEYPDAWDIEQILDAHHDNHPRVKLWAMFEPLNPSEIASAVNDLLHLIRRIKKQEATL